MYTSGRNLFSTPLDASTSRFPVCGETRSVNATPRTRFTNPSSHQSIATSDRAIGSFRLISPPAPGETPRFAIVIVSPSSTPKFLFSIGSVTVRNVSTLVTPPRRSFIPVRVKSSGFFANKQRHKTTSKKYPIPLELPQSCDIRRPAGHEPGLVLHARPGLVDHDLHPVRELVDEAQQRGFVVSQTRVLVVHADVVDAVMVVVVVVVVERDARRRVGGREGEDGTATRRDATRRAIGNAAAGGGRRSTDDRRVRRGRRTATLGSPASRTRAACEGPRRR